MRKIFTSLKTIVAATLVAAMSLSVSCSYDDTGIVNEIENVKADLAALAERVTALENKLNSEVDALKALINEQVVVVDVVTDANGNQTIKLSDGSEITVLAPVGCDHVCDVLQYRVVEGVLEVSADGQNWIAVKVAPEQVVANIVLNEDGTATITLANGEEFTVVKAELIECEATRSQLFVAPGETKSIKFTINDAVSDVNVMNQPLGWSASIEVAPAVEDEDNVDPGMGILAAGGADFLLNITGPSADFVKAGYAQKEGFVAVHFNSANGGCKVAKVAVNLAELGISVDASGNITISNSVAKSAGFDEMGEPLYNFADFFIGIVDAADYATYGDKVFVDTFDDWTYEYTANVASTQRTTGFQNIVDLQWYEAGVCEKEVYTLTVDQLAGAFWPKYEYEMGKEYIIFVTTESEMASYVEQPVLTNAAKASYKRVFVEANLDKENTTWNDATAEFTLAGYNYYIVGWLPVADLEQFVEYGMAADLDSALVFYLKNGGNLMGAGAVVTDMQGTYKLSELAALSMTGWAPMLNADTEYLFFVYPMNAETEMEFYTHQVVDENIRNYGSFRTKALVQGEFDAAAQFELVAHEEKTIEVNATFGEEVVSVVYNWYEESFMDPEEAAAAILGDLYYSEFVTFGEGEHTIAASKFEYYGLPDPVYLGVLAINANGEYVYVEQSFSRNEGGDEPGEPSEVTYDSADTSGDIYGSDYYVNLHGSDGSRVVMNFYGISEYDTYFIPAGTYDFGAWFGAVYTGGYSRVEYSDGTRDNIYGGTVAVAEVDGKYRIEVNANIGDAYTAFSAVYEGLIDGLILPSEYVEPEPETEPEPVVNAVNPVRAEYDNKFDLYEYNGGDAEYAFWLYDENNNYVEVIHRFGSHTGWNDVFEAKLVKDGVESVATSVQTQAPNTWNCNAGELYFVVIATFENGEAVEIQAQLPAVEVNYLGEGSTYAPGSENQGGDEGGEEGGEEIVPTELTITSHFTLFNEGMEHEIGFYYDEANGKFVDIDFISNPIVAGTYTLANGLSGMYCKSHGGDMSACEVIVTENADGTLTFDATFKAGDENWYHFLYTAKIYESAGSDSNVVTLNTKSAGEKIGTYYWGWTLSDAEGNNSVKLVVDEYYAADKATDFPKANEYTAFQSSVSQIMNGGHFSFVNESLKVNGVNYKNDDVSNAKLTVVEATSITIEFTVGGEDYTFVYSII
ncbi:MAG: hypothetical protein IKU96_07550 [Alistipes sp.]|nr:hypothetical protein [Alistipes sp.]